MEVQSDLDRDSSIEDSNCGLTIEEGSEDVNIDDLTSQERIDGLTLYQSGEDPARPPLQVPANLFASSSSELKSDNHSVFSHQSILTTSNQGISVFHSQNERNNRSRVTKKADVNLTPHVFESTGNARPHVITIIQDSCVENGIQEEDSVSKDMLKRFVIDAEGIHPSIRPIDQVQSPPVELFQENHNENIEIATEDKLVDHDFGLEKQQVVIFSGDDDDDSVALARHDDDESLTITLIEDAEDVSVPENASNTKSTRSNSESGDFVQSKPTLDLSFELVAEVQSLDGHVVRREVMTQADPAHKKVAPVSRKRKLEDNSDKNSSTIRVEISGKDGEKKFKCSICSLKFVTEELCDIHHKCHQHLMKNYKCLFCEYTDTQWLKMYNHLFQHGIEKPFKCTKCVFTCINRSDLNAHMAVHSNLKAFTCGKCNRSFKHRRNMKAHQRTCSGLDESGKPQRIEEEKHVCEICKRQLSTKKNLDKHMEIHTDIKPYICDQCGHSTRLKESLVMHKRLHTGEKPYKCEICDYATPDRSSLRRHKRTHTNEKPYSCQYCCYRAIQKHCLDTHMRRKHTGEQFVCGLCHYATHDRYGLNQHFKRHQNADGTITHEVEIVDLNNEGKSAPVTSIAAIDGENRSSTYITLPSGAVLKSTEIGKDTVIEESSKKEMQEAENNNNTVLVQINQDGSTEHIVREPSTSKPDEPESKEEVATVQLGQLEANLLQQIHRPGDEVFIQETGDIVIRRQDGRLLVIHQQNIQEELITNTDLNNKKQGKDSEVLVNVNDNNETS